MKSLQRNITVKLPTLQCFTNPDKLFLKCPYLLHFDLYIISLIETIEGVIFYDSKHHIWHKAHCGNIVQKTMVGGGGEMKIIIKILAVTAALAACAITGYMNRD